METKSGRGSGFSTGSAEYRVSFTRPSYRSVHHARNLDKSNFYYRALLYVWKLSNAPGQSSRFAVFLSDEGELPLATSLRGSHKTLAGALQATSAPIRYRTNFACRPVENVEKLTVSDMMAGYVQPFEGASLVLERDREGASASSVGAETSIRIQRFINPPPFAI